MPFLAAAVVVAASYGAGALVAGDGRLTGRDLRGRSTQFALGFGVLAALALLVGVLGAFTRPVLDAIAATFAALGVVAAVRDTRGLRVPEPGPHRPLLAGAAAIAVVDVVLASAPPTSGDATAYHLTAPELWLRSGRVFAIWWDWATFQPFALEMHGAYAMAISDGRGAMVAAAALSALATVPIYGLGREVAGRTAGALAALLWFGQGMFLWEATGAFVELVAAGLIALAVWHLVVFRRSQALRDALLAGAALGLAASTKYHALLFLPALALVALLLRRDRRGGPAAAAAVLLAAAVGLPWYVRNWAVTGNPLYPLADGIFGGKLWGKTDAAWFRDSYAGYGPTSAWKAPLFPLMFLASADRYERGYSFSPAIFLLAPLGAVVGGRWARVFGAGILAYLVVWSVSMHQITRYLVLVLPLATVLASVGLLWAFERRWWRQAAVLVAAATIAVFVAITGLFTWQVGPGVVETESSGAYVQRLTGTYDALKWLDTRLPHGGRVLVTGVRNLYWLHRPYVADYPPLFAPGDPEAAVRRRMRDYDVRYVATLAGVPAAWLRPELRLLAVLRVPVVTSRTLLRRDGTELLRVYAWCRSSCGS